MPCPSPEFGAGALRRFIVLAVTIAAVPFGAACRRAGPAPAPPKVTVSRPVVRDVVEWDEYTGRLEAVESVEVRARVSGYLQSVNFQDGATVKEGDLLFVI